MARPAPELLSWRFEPRLERPASREESARWSSRLETAVVAAHGTGTAIEVSLSSGIDPMIHLSVRGTSGERWVCRVLSSAYDPGQWHRVHHPPAESPVQVRAAWRRGHPGERAAAAPEPGIMIRTCALAFSSLRPGVRLVCRIVPAPMAAPWFEFLDPPPEPSNFTLHRMGDRRQVPRPIVPPRSEEGPDWTAAVELSMPAGLSASERARAIGAAESGWRRAGVGTISFAGPAITRLLAPRLRLSSRELTGVLPAGDGGGTEGGTSTEATAGLPLGRTRTGTVISAPVESGQGRHLAVLGETGMGKSSLLIGVAVRAAALGGLIVLDPMGDTAREIRAELRTAGRSSVLIAPSEPGGPAINALEGIGGAPSDDPVRSERRLADIVHALRRVRSGRYVDSSFWGPRLEEMLTRAIRAAAGFPGGTLADAHTLLTTSGLTRRPVPSGAEESMRELADRIRQRPEDADGARRLLLEVVRNPTLDRMLCARAPTLAAGDVVASGGIVLVSGDAALVGETTARYLLAVYLALVWSELLASDTRGKTFVLLDEAQWFAHESLAEMLRLARRRDVHVLLATQSIASLPEAVGEAVWTNVADFATFRGLPDEAREFARAAPGLTAERLLSLRRGEAAVLLGKGASVRWVRSARIPRRTDRSDRPTSGSGTVLNPQVQSASPAPPVESVGFGTITPQNPPGSMDDLLGWIRVRCLSSDRDDLVPISLREIRECTGAGPELVRRAGGRLGRMGAIRRIDRTADGTVWWLVPSGLAGISPVAAAPGRDDSSLPQPS